MNIDYTLFSKTQLRDTIDRLLDRVERDEALRPELDAQLANIYDALADPSFRDYFGVIDAAIDSHIAVTDSMETRAELLDALIAEYGNRMATAMATGRTFVGASHHFRNEGWIH
jgi:hypothetical protein